MSPTVRILPDTVDSGVKDRRLLYTRGVSGGVATNEPVTHTSGLINQRSSNFNTMALLFLAAVAIILYISNIIAVNRLAVEVNDLEQSYGTLKNSNEILRADINRKSSLERIGKIASEQLGLQHPKSEPMTLEVNGKLMKDKQGSKGRR